MLVECGFVRAVASDGAEFTFRPSFGRIAALGAPHEIVALYGALHGPNAEAAAAHVLAGLCDQDDVSSLIGWHDATPRRPRWWKFWCRRDHGGKQDQRALDWRPGAMPRSEQVIVARHLMRHGIVGTAKPGSEGSGEFSARFDAAEYIAAAGAHLGLSTDQAEALSMSEFQRQLEMKFPQLQRATLPTEESYYAAMDAADEFIARLKEKKGG